MGPIDYSGGMQPANPMMSGMRGFAVGDALRQRQLAQQQAMQQQQMQMQQQQKLQAELSAIAAKPGGGTVQDYAATITKNAAVFPKLHESLKESMAAMNVEQQRAALESSSQILSALASNKPEVAARSLEDRATAMENSGDTKGAERARAMAEQARTNPQALMPTFTGLVLSLPGGDKVVEGMTKLGDESRKQALQPDVALKASGDARAAVADAASKEAYVPHAPAKALAEVQSAQAEAITKGVTAENAPAMAKQTLKNLVATGNLTNAQAGAAVMLTKKYGAEIGKMALEAANGNPEKKFDFEKGLRSEYTAATKEAQAIKDAYSRVKVANDNGVGDIALLYGFIKMLDPLGAVREGDIATVNLSRSIPERVKVMYARALEGRNMSPEQRVKVLEQSAEIARTADQRITQEQTRIKPVISNYKLNDINVFGGDDAQNPVPPKPAGPKTTPPIPGATRNIVVDW